jgi:hypothetical protein
MQTLFVKLQILIESCCKYLVKFKQKHQKGIFFINYETIVTGRLVVIQYYFLRYLFAPAPLTANA